MLSHLFGPKVSRCKPRKITLYKKADWDGLRLKMAAYSESVLSDQGKYTVESLWAELKSQIEDGISQFIPSKMVSGKNKLVTQDIKRLIRKRDKEFYRQRRTKDPSDRAYYKTLKHLVQCKMRTGYSKYVEDILGILDANMTDDFPSEKPAPLLKKLFSFIKHAKQVSSAISLLKDQGKELSEGVDKANALNRQFQSVFSPKSPLSLKQLCEMTAGANPQVIGQHCKFPLMSDIEVGVEGVSKLLKNLKTEKAAGPDQIRPVLLKELHSEFSPVITLLFQLSLGKGCLPSDWVTSNVTPLFKNRPMSFTLILCKTLEHIVTSKLVKHFTSNSIIYDLQHGFREKRSCETQLTMLVDELASNIQHGKQTYLILLDFSKAFDKVSHEKLPYNMFNYWIQGKTLAWIKGFLANRSTMVVVDGINSSSIPVTSSVYHNVRSLVRSCFLPTLTTSRSRYVHM